MRVGKFAHPSPLPARTYWALWDDQGPQVIFSIGDGNIIVEQALGWETFGVFIAWLAELLPALEWPQVVLAMTVMTDVVVRLAGPVPSQVPVDSLGFKVDWDAVARSPPLPKYKRRKRKPPTTWRFLKKRLTTPRRSR